MGSVVGGLLGGYITLIGVKQTIWGQREQESIKLIPQKLVNLHKLSKQIKEFTTLFSEGIHQIHEMGNEVGEREFLDTSEIIDEYFKCTNKIVDIFNGLMDKEYDFIDIGSGIDIEIYKDIKALFETLGEKLSSTMGDF